MKMVVRSMSEGETIDEEGYDIARDMGKVPPTKGKKDATTMPPSKEMMKTQKVNKGPSALDIVKSNIKKKYGKGDIMGEAKDELDENIINKIKQAITKFRNNPKGKIPLIPPDKFLPTAGKREADVFKNAGVDPF